MDDAKRNTAMKGLTLSAAYCAVFLLGWYYSLDQWFLPAGIRVAALLFLPYRYWPYVFAGDAGALLVLRGPKVDQYGEAWAYLSPFLLMPLIACLALAFNRRFKTARERWQWLPLIGISLALWSALSNMTLNIAFSGPGAFDSLAEYFRVALGQYLGILIVVPPLFVWARRSRTWFPTDKLTRDAIISASILGAMCFAIVLRHDIEASLIQSLLLLMMLPAVGMTFLHGWRGAALGIVAVNLAIGMTLPRIGVAGAYDATAFVAQQALAAAASALLVLGTVISEHYEKARRSGVAEQEAIKLAQSSFFSTEQVLREQLLYLAQMQLGVDDERRDMTEWLKSRGHYEAAMDLNTRGVMHRRMFDVQSQALYPMRIEQDGLYAVVHSETFTDFWAGDAEVIYAFKGQPRDLSVDLQLVAYRCICHAFALLSECQPDEYRIKMRVWQGRQRRGIVLFITTPNAPPKTTQAGIAAAALLNARVKAHGGIARRDPYRVRILLSEPIAAEYAYIEPSLAYS
jgi:MASE1